MIDKTHQIQTKNLYQHRTKISYQSSLVIKVRKLGDMFVMSVNSLLCVQPFSSVDCRNKLGFIHRQELACKKTMASYNCGVVRRWIFGKTYLVVLNKRSISANSRIVNNSHRLRLSKVINAWTISLNMFAVRLKWRHVLSEVRKRLEKEDSVFTSPMSTTAPDCKHSRGLLSETYWDLYFSYDAILIQSSQSEYNVNPINFLLRLFRSPKY